VFVTSRNTSRSTFDAGRYMISLLTTGRVAYVGIACQQMSGFHLSKSCSATNAVHTRGGAKPTPRRRCQRHGSLHLLLQSIRANRADGSGFVVVESLNELAGNAKQSRTGSDTRSAVDRSFHRRCL
jgi:hypothetical protein